MYSLSGIYVFPHKMEGKSTSLRRESVPPPNMQDHWLPRASQLKQPNKHLLLPTPLSLMHG
ncbi:hypothetical protein DPMN_152620 [Dreissena polymorpha]|uniref:Uncharacterized protein n=1 Tax=Dreissena polymorpha TaxID=45954 RepID=A0A9D4FLL2_DREPO|nr:hypothetical protein DPMN_152620 [Dreissena polymorpha]